MVVDKPTWSRHDRTILGKVLESFLPRHRKHETTNIAQALWRNLDQTVAVSPIAVSPIAVSPIAVVNQCEWATHLIKGLLLLSDLYLSFPS